LGLSLVGLWAGGCGRRHGSQVFSTVPSWWKIEARLLRGRSTRSFIDCSLRAHRIGSIASESVLEARLAGAVSWSPRWIADVADHRCFRHLVRMDV